MALTSREVAEAYIDVHGDLSPFRKQLNKAGEDARKAGRANADKFSDGWNKRLEASMGDKWETLMDAMYSNDKVDWDRLIGKFDSTDLDAASEKIQLFIEEMREGGKLTKKQYQEVSNEVRNVIKAKQQELFVQADLTDAIQEHVDVVSEQVRVTTDWTDVENKLTGVMQQHVAVLQDEIDLNHQYADAIEDDNHVLWSQVGVTEEVTRKKYSFIAGLRQLIGFFKLSSSEGAKHNRVMSLMSGIGDRVAKSWARMDSTVRMVLTLIGVSAGAMATLGSGLAGAGTALAASLATSITAAVPLAAVFAGMGVAIGLAVSSMDSMKAAFPAIEANATRVGDAWQAQADRFGQMWGPPLAEFLGAFATKLAQFDFGTPMGKAMGEITRGFTEVVNGPAFTALMQAMSTTLPGAVASLGEGMAHVSNIIVSMLAGAAPVAKLLADDFLRWAGNMNKVVDGARKSGVMNEIFEQARTSLLHVLDLAGSLGLMFGSIFSIGAESGNRMLASLTQIVDSFTAWMNTAAGRDAMLQWFNNAEAIVRSMEPLLVGMGQAMAILVTPETIAQFANLNSIMGQLLPIIAQVLAVISQLGILNILAQLFLVVGQAVQPLLPPLMQIAGILGPLLQQAVIALAPLFNALVAAILPIVNAVLQVVGVVAPVLIPAITSIVAAVTPVIAVIGELIAFIVGQLAPILGPFINGIIQNFVGLIQGISNAVMGVVNIVKGIMTGDWPMVWNGAKQLVGGVVQAIANFIQLWIVGKAVALVKGGVTAILNFFRSGWTNVSTTVSGAIQRVVSFVSSGMSRVGSAVSSWMSRVGSSISSAWNSAVGFVSGAMGRIGSAVSGGVGRVMGFIGSLPGRIVGALSGLGGRLSAMGAQMMAGFVGGIQSMAGRIFSAAMDAVGSAVNAVKNFLGIRSPSRLMAWMARQTWQGFIVGGEAMERPLMTASEQLAATVAAGFSHMYDEGKLAAEALAAGLTANKALVSGALDNLTPQLTAAERRLTVGTGPGFAGVAPAPAGSQTIFEPGAIQFQTQVRDGKTAANQLLDVLASKTKIG